MIVVQPSEGRLGNQLQRLAHVLAYAEEEKANVYNIVVGEVSSSFVGLKGNIFGRYPALDTRLPVSCGCRRLLSKFIGTLTFKRLLRLLGFPQYNYWASNYESRVYLAGNPVIKKQSLRGTVHLYGHYYYCHELVKKHATVIRRYFSLTPAAARPVVKFMEGCHRNNSLIIGIHLRRGDYKTYMNGEYYFDDAVYAGAMKKIQELWSPIDPLFLLCSDAPLPAEAFSGFRHVVLGTSAIDDLYALSLCDAVIGPKSAFTAWSSFFGSVPRYVMRRGATQPEQRKDFWVCDDLRGGVTTDEKVD